MRLSDRFHLSIPGLRHLDPSEGSPFGRGPGSNRRRFLDLYSSVFARVVVRMAVVELQRRLAVDLDGVARSKR
jgi:hypothetical protein